jgi:LuxR family transcriptional regulator, transcriptional regulator of spore coat protein
MLQVDQLDVKPVLTSREHQILELVAIGFSAKEVALKIAIAPRTVERHIENIRLKMRARNRTHMVTCAAMSGLLKTADHDDADVEPMPEKEQDFRPMVATNFAKQKSRISELSVLLSARGIVAGGMDGIFLRRLA